MTLPSNNKWHFELLYIWCYYYLLITNHGRDEDSDWFITGVLFGTYGSVGRGHRREQFPKWVGFLHSVAVPYRQVTVEVLLQPDILPLCISLLLEFEVNLIQEPQSRFTTIFEVLGNVSAISLNNIEAKEHVVSSTRICHFYSCLPSIPWDRWSHLGLLQGQL